MAPLLSILLTNNTLQPLYRAILPKLHINRKYLCTMITSYVAVRDLGLGSLEVEQIVEVVNLIISLFESPTLASYLLRESLEYMQLESGLSTPVLESKFSVFRKLVILCWLSLLKESLFFY